MLQLQKFRQLSQKKLCPWSRRTIKATRHTYEAQGAKSTRWERPSLPGGIFPNTSGDLGLLLHAWGEGYRDKAVLVSLSPLLWALQTFFVVFTINTTWRNPEEVGICLQASPPVCLRVCWLCRRSWSHVTATMVVNLDFGHFWSFLVCCALNWANVLRRQNSGNERCRFPCSGGASLGVLIWRFSIFGINSIGSSY